MVESSFKFHVGKVKIRKSWRIDPATKVHKVKGEYNRNQEKVVLKKELENALREDNNGNGN